MDERSAKMRIFMVDGTLHICTHVKVQKVSVLFFLVYIYLILAWIGARNKWRREFFRNINNIWNDGFIT